MKENFRAVVVAQLVERSPLTPEIRDSTPVIGKLYTEHFFTVNCVEKAKMKKKTPRIGHIFLKRYLGHTKADLSGHSAADLVWRLHQLGGRMVLVVDGVVHALPLHRVRPFEHQLKV